MKIHLLGMAVVLSTASGCFPMGNSLGMAGEYQGDVTSNSNGEQTTYSGGNSTVATVEVSETNRMVTYIESGYESDAIISGIACGYIPLKASGDKLELESTITCERVSDTTTTAGSTTAKSTTNTTQTVKNLTVTNKSGGKVKIHLEISYKQTKENDGTKTSDLEIEIVYDGELSRTGGE